MSFVAIASLVVLAMHLMAFVSLVLVMHSGRGKATGRFTPHVAVLKPLKGLDEGIRENLESFFGLDYPDFELVFGVAEPDDPVIPIVRSVMASHPEVTSRLVVGGQDETLKNPKVRTLVKLLSGVQGEFVVVSDSNVRATPGYIGSLVAPFEDKKVGLATNVIAGVGEQTLGAMLEHLHLNAYISTAQAFCRVVGGFTSVIGKSMALRLSALRAAGGLVPLASFLAEDYLLGRRIAKCGYRAVLVPHPVHNFNASTRVHAFLDRHYRWLGMRWRINPFSCLLELVTIPTPWLAAWLVLEPSQAPLVLAVLVLLSLTEQLAAMMVRGGQPLPLASALLKPLKDLCHAMLLVTSAVNDRVNWRGHVIRLGWRTRITFLPPERRVDLPPFLFPMRMGDEWPSARAPWIARSAAPRG